MGVTCEKENMPNKVFQTMPNHQGVFLNSPVRVVNQYVDVANLVNFGTRIFQKCFVVGRIEYFHCGYKPGSPRLSSDYSLVVVCQIEIVDVGQHIWEQFGNVTYAHLVGSNPLSNLEAR